jgi:hypothetical protein
MNTIVGLLWTLIPFIALGLLPLVAVAMAAFLKPFERRA